MRCLLFICVLASPASASTIYVAASAPPGGTGASWSSPYNDLQLALAAAGIGDEIRIAQGTYKPAPTGGPRSATFNIPSSITLRGGFAGPGTPNPDDRNLTLYITTLSGDLSGNDGPNFTNYADNVHHVVTMTSTSASTSLDGLFIRAGFNGGIGANGTGAGLFMSGGNPVIVDCTFTACDGQFMGGGGMGLVNSFGTITRCTFIANRTQSFGGGGLKLTGSGPSVTDCVSDSNIGGSGAAVLSTGGSDGTFTNCTFKDNVGQIGSSSGPGFYENQSTSTLVNCTFLRNTTGGGGGGLFVSGAGLTQVRNCSFIANRGTADGGGAVYIVGQGAHATLFVNCFFSGNRSDLASGTTAFVGPGALADMTNCTIANSGLGSGFGTLSGSAGSIRLYNCILWNNANQLGSGQSAQFQGSPPLLDHCIIQGWTGSLGGIANSGADPRFVDLNGADNIAGNADDDASLLPGSPAIDAAANGIISTIITTDLLGNPRFRDDPGTPDTGSGTPPLADLGCYEFQGITYYANCDQSTLSPILNANDFACFLNRFAAQSPAANCDGSTAPPVLNANDFVCFLNTYAAGCP